MSLYNLQIIIGSYLTLEELLIIYSNKIKLRDFLLKLYYKNLPTINQTCQNGDLATFKYLIKLGLKPPQKALYYASKNGHLWIVKHLLDKSLIRFSAKHSQNAMDIAIKMRQWEVIRYLGRGNLFPSRELVERISAHGDLDMIKYLVENNILILTQDRLNTPVDVSSLIQMVLYRASIRNRLKIVKYICEKNIKPIYVVIENTIVNGHLELIKYFSENCIESSQYLFNIACRRGNLNIIKCLTEHGIKPSQEAINTAILCGNVKIIKYLGDFFYSNIVNRQ